LPLHVVLLKVPIDVTIISFVISDCEKGTVMETARFIIFPLIGYLLGSVPTGYLYGKWLRGIDIRKHGSGNVGATNASRVLGKPAFVIVLAFDIVKGALPVLIARWAQMDELVQVLAGLAAIIGHTFTIFLWFRGGKGVATSAGVFLALAPVNTSMALIIFFIVLAFTRYISLSSIVASIALLGSALVQFITKEMGQWTFFAIFLACILVVLRHRSNISRLKAGTEPKIGQRNRSGGD